LSCQKVIKINYVVRTLAGRITIALCLYVQYCFECTIFVYDLIFIL